MHLVASVIWALTLPLLKAADLMQSGRWCFTCHAEKDKVCDEGRCLEVEADGDATDIVHSEPACEWGGGD